jgi:D-glycero-alpha-D-manno-heptose-7-phosphate kinase
MIISQTPFRISFFGGGTDYPAWYRKYGGSVLSTTIDKYCFISCRRLPPFFEHKHRVVYSVVERVKEIEEIQHPAVREVMRYMNVKDGLEIHHDGDLPARSGVGSSSSFTVGLLNTLFALRGQVISKRELAQLAIHLEQNVIQETVGSQDQIAVAVGGLNKIDFHQDDSFNVTPLILHPERKQEFESSLLLYFTGLSRLAPEVAQSKVANLEKMAGELRAMRRMVDEAIDILQDRKTPIEELGKLMHESWMLKRQLSDKVTNPRIDEIYNTAIAAGATGGKLIGAGGGGFILLCVRPGEKDQVREKLRPLLEVSFRFENQGSRIALYDPDLMAREGRTFLERPDDLARPNAMH